MVGGSSPPGPTILTFTIIIILRLCNEIIIGSLFNFIYLESITDGQNNLIGYWHGFGLIVEIKECEDKLCGVIEHIFVSDDKDPKTPDENNKDKELKSRTLWVQIFYLIFSRQPDSSGTHTGRIYNPDEASYKSKIRLLSNGDLEIEGCFTVICRKVGEWLPVTISIDGNGKRVAKLTNPLAIF